MNNIERKSWEEFRESGMLWFINSILHTFGWCICTNLNNDGNIDDAYPARTKFRGFPEASNTKGYKAITEYLYNNIEQLKTDIDE